MEKKSTIIRDLKLIFLLLDSKIEDKKLRIKKIIKK
tara:strand:+ start:434 stop:541 length:108 start_codon:yes stop_codon:yes gene_type:complete